jgi:hypothetical protein
LRASYDLAYASLEPAECRRRRAVLVRRGMQSREGLFFLGRLFGPGVSPSFIGTNRVKVGCTARSRLGMVGGLTMPECRFYNLERDGQAVIARIDLKLDDDATEIAHAKQLD